MNKKRKHAKTIVLEPNDVPIPSSTNRDKASIKDLYLEFKDLERRLADTVVSGREDDMATVGKDAPTDIEGVKAEKKKIKREIQAWVEAFEAREGRAALQE